MFSRPLTHWFCLLMVGWNFAVASAQHREERIWTSRDGRTLEASLLRADEGSAVLRLTNGREVEVTLDLLSEGDLAYLEMMRTTGRTLELTAMPEESRIDPAIEVEGGPRNFLTPHFEFGTEQGVAKSFIAEAARVFEGTFKAVESLPLGIKPRPAAGAARFRTLFLSRETFDSEIAGIIPESGSGVIRTSVAGVYLPQRQEVLVPFSSLETGRSGSQITLRRTSDTSTLIHEIVHQVMHDWLVITPVWFSEGLAEYLAAVPYQNGRFEFRNARQGLMETLEGQYRIVAGVDIPLIHPGDFLEMKNGEWRGSADDYRSAMLLIYYYMHLDQPDRPGAALGGYLHLLERGKSEAETYIADHNRAVSEFEEKRLAFNEAVDRYNIELLNFRASITAYNERVTLLNRQIQSDTPPAERVELGPEPVAPTPPERPEVPEILRSRAESGPIDIAARIHETARPALTRERDLDEVGDQVEAALQEAGFRVSLRPRGSAYGPNQGGSIPVRRPQ